MPINTLLFLIGLLNLFGGLLSVFSWFFVRKNYKNKKINRRNEKVSVIIPCKGSANLLNFGKQNYSNYEVIVVVDSEEERENLKEIYGNFLFVISKENSVSGKNAALLTGLKYASGDVIVFADADIIPHENWLSYLVSYLNNNAVTSYRWYFRSPMLCVWNASIASVLFYKKFNFCWGGSTAIRKNLLEEIEIKKIWEKEMVDDLTLTKTLKERGIEIEFIPQAISESIEEENKIEWMNKQFLWVKEYFPSLWTIAIFFNFGMRISNVLGIVYIFIEPLTGILLLSSLLFDFLRGWQEYYTFSSLMNYPKDKFLHPSYHILLRPAVSFIILYNLLSSIFIKEVEWKGRKYLFKYKKIKQ